jgi:hypothetical protein
LPMRTPSSTSDQRVATSEGIWYSQVLVTRYSQSSIAILPRHSGNIWRREGSSG